MNPQSKKGFSLVELIVVIAIVGILASIAFFAINSAKQQSRDKIRQSQLKEMQVALELYKSQHGRYPAQGCGAGNGIWAGPGTFSPGGQITCEEYIVGLVPNYIAALPKDPNQEYERDKGFQYLSVTDGSVYKLMSHGAVESIFVTSYSNEFARCPVSTCTGNPGCPAGGPQSYVYAVYSKGTECW